MTKRAFIIHGWDGYPEEGWFPWIKRELEKKGFITQIPAMPQPEHPKIMKEKLDAKIIIEHAKGHFSGSDNATKIQTILIELLKMANN